MVNHGTFKEVQRNSPWEVTAEECVVTGSVENISRALKQTGIPHGDRLDPKARAAPKEIQDVLSVPRRLSSQASKSFVQNSGSSTIKFTAREKELIIVAFQCLKNDRKSQVSLNPCILDGRDVLLLLLSP